MAQPLHEIRLEPQYALRDVRRLFFPSRSIRWLRQQIGAGSFGPVLKDAGGWLVPESGLRAYLARHQVTPIAS